MGKWVYSAVVGLVHATARGMYYRKGMKSEESPLLSTTVYVVVWYNYVRIYHLS